MVNFGKIVSSAGHAIGKVSSHTGNKIAKVGKKAGFLGDARDWARRRSRGRNVQVGGREWQYSSDCRGCSGVICASAAVISFLTE